MQCMHEHMSRNLVISNAAKIHGLYDYSFCRVFPLWTPSCKPEFALTELRANLASVHQRLVASEHDWMTRDGLRIVQDPEGHVRPRQRLTVASGYCTCVTASNQQRVFRTTGWAIRRPETDCTAPILVHAGHYRGLIMTAQRRDARRRWTTTYGRWTTLVTLF